MADNNNTNKDTLELNDEQLKAVAGGTVEPGTFHQGDVFMCDVYTGQKAGTMKVVYYKVLETTNYTSEEDIIPVSEHEPYYLGFTDLSAPIVSSTTVRAGVLLSGTYCDCYNY